jgi:glutamyl-tRNA reductase
MFGPKDANCSQFMLERKNWKLQLNFQSKKNSDFNEEQAEIISARIIQKITTQFANHKDDDTMVDESIEWIEKVFKIGLAAK